jgi:hypothetical protein
VGDETTGGNYFGENRERSAYMYSSILPLIFLEHPEDWRPSSFNLKGWTDTVEGYINEAQKLAACILRNRKLMRRDYAWAVSINIEKELEPKDIRTTWSKVCRKLNQSGIIALWVREPSLSNHCNYHLLVKSEQSEAEVKEAIRWAMPNGLPYHSQVKPIENQIMYPRYILKARTQGDESKDRWRNKRLLFTPKFGLTKYGTIGKFWEEPKAKLWKVIKHEEEELADGLNHPGVKNLAKYVHELFNRTISVKELERRFAWQTENPAIQQWITQVEKLEQAQATNAL